MSASTPGACRRVVPSLPHLYLDEWFLRAHLSTRVEELLEVRADEGEDEPVRVHAPPVPAGKHQVAEEGLGVAVEADEEVAEVGLAAPPVLRLGGDHGVGARGAAGPWPCREWPGVTHHLPSIPARPSPPDPKYTPDYQARTAQPK